MARLTSSYIHKSWKKTVIICIISVMVTFAIYIYYYPDGILGPSRLEKEKMKKSLFEIDKIVLSDKASDGQQSIIDISKFREFTPTAEFKGFLIIKGERIPATAMLKDGKAINILMSVSYPVLYYDVNNSTFKGFGNSFEFTGDGAVKYLKLIEELHIQ